MAAIVDEKNKIITPATKGNAPQLPVIPAAAQTTAAQTTATQTPAAQTATAQKQPASPYTGLSGISESTQNMLGQYSQGYQASNDVTQAQDYLNSVVTGKPGDYSSNYKQQLDDLYNQVMNRQQFTYDLGSDMLYQQYKNQYQNLGKQAMMDTTAQAAALTGGYGNSYAATAGNQAYQNYLQQLNSIVPELYDKAYGRYVQEGQDLMNKYNLTSDLENAEYAKYRDTVADWQNERDYANSDYWNKYNADYSNWQNMLNQANQFAQWENSQYNSNKEMAYNQAMAIIQTGNVPNQDLLDLIGLTKKDAKAMAKVYKKKISSSGGGGGGGGRSSGGSGGGSGNGGGDTTNWYNEVLALFNSSKASVSSKSQKAYDYWKAGRITRDQYANLLAML